MGAGGGIVALSTAAAFARALPQVAVTLIETPLDPAALTDRLPGARSSIGRFHSAIGLNEVALIGSGAASWSIGTHYRGWSVDGGDWYHVTGEYGPRIGSIAFHHLWARARRVGGALPYHAYCAAGAMAAAGKFALPVDDPASPFSRYDHGLRLDLARYRQTLARHGDGLGVTRLTAQITDAEVDDTGAVGSLRLDDGRHVVGDLYIDATGPGATIRSLLGGDHEDWRTILPSCCVTLTESHADPAAIDQVARMPGGWTWDAPGAGMGHVGATDRGANGVIVEPGRWVEPWRRNVLAIGDAAVRLDPLGWFGLHLAHQAIERVLALLPDRDLHQVELAEYNRRTAEDTCTIRDLTAAFYHGAPASADPFWESVTALDMPPSQIDAIELFRRRGRLPPIDEDTLGEAWRIAALIGLGIVPRQTDVIADAIDPAACSSAMAGWANGIASVVGELPSYARYLTETRRRLRAQTTNME